MLKKLRIKFVVVIMSIVLAMLLIIFGLVYHFTAENMAQHTENTLHALVQAAKRPDQIMVQQDVGMPYIIIRVDMFGQMLASGVSSYDIEDEKFIQSLAKDILRRGVHSGMLEEYGLQYYCDMDITGQYFALVDVSVQSRSLQSLVSIAVWVGVGAFIVFFCISLLLAFWAVKPVEKAWKQQKQFISDASHELKTPLTVILSNAELLNNSEIDREEAQQYLENITVTAHRMRSLTEGMLELSRADNGQVKMHFENIDFSNLLVNSVLPFEPAFYEKHMRLESRITDGIRVKGCQDYLTQVIGILLENALKYSDPGVVSVNLQYYGKGKCLLAVANPGVPLTPQEQKDIFRRFYRADTSRSHDGSFGLGLAIAKTVVQEHDGEIWVQSNSTGNCFFVSLPIIQ